MDVPYLFCDMAGFLCEGSMSLKKGILQFAMIACACLISGSAHR